MDSPVFDASGASTSATARKREKRRRRSIEQELGRELGNDAGASGLVANFQNTDGTSAENEGEPPIKRARFASGRKDKSLSRHQTEHVCEEQESKQRKLRRSTRAHKDSILNTAVDGNSGDINVSIGTQHRSSSVAGCPHGRRKNSASQGRNSSQMSSRGSNLRTANFSSEIPPSPDYVRIVQQMEEDENYARSLQAEFDCETLEPAGSEGINVLHSDSPGVPAPTITEQVATTSQQSTDPETSPRRLRGNRRGSRRDRASRRIRSALNSRSSRPSSLAYVLGREAAIDEIGLSFPITSLLNIMNTDMDNISVTLWRINQEIISFGDLLTEPGDLNDGLDSRGLSTAQINRLPTRSYHRASASDHSETFQTTECQICLCAYEEGATLRTLECFHEFHKSCIDKWLKINRTCPVCRALVNANSSDQ